MEKNGILFWLVDFNGIGTVPKKVGKRKQPTACDRARLFCCMSIDAGQNLPPVNQKNETCICKSKHTFYVCTKNPTLKCTYV